MADLFDTTGPTLAERVAYLDGWEPTHPADLVAFNCVREVLADRARMVEVLGLVVRMRQAQRAYFRSKADLPGCKALESKVDGILKSREG